MASLGVFGGARVKGVSREGGGICRGKNSSKKFRNRGGDGSSVWGGLKHMLFRGERGKRGL